MSGCARKATPTRRGDVREGIGTVRRKVGEVIENVGDKLKVDRSKVGRPGRAGAVYSQARACLGHHRRRRAWHPVRRRPPEADARRSAASRSWQRSVDAFLDCPRRLRRSSWRCRLTSRSTHPPTCEARTPLTRRRRRRAAAGLGRQRLSRRSPPRPSRGDLTTRPVRWSASAVIGRVVDAAPNSGAAIAAVRRTTPSSGATPRA